MYYNYTNAEEEDVSEIFVRVNSGGVALKQNDFILTLLSLYWDEGRKEIEQFSMESTYPSKDKITSYNQLTEVTAQDVIRVVMAYAFDRARLKYGYKLLRGADFDKKGAVDITLRDQRFDVLKVKLPDVLNVHIERVLQDEGFETKLTQQTRDGGRDIIATKYEMGKPVVFYIECKRYGRQNSVGVNIYGVGCLDAVR